MNKFAEYLAADDYNIIAVDWSHMATWDNYFKAAENAILVGQHSGEFMTMMVRDYGLKPEMTHLIGHSLGAHLSGHAGRKVQENGLGKIARITGK